MRIIRILSTVIFLLFSFLAIGQGKSKVFEFKKGEVLDLLYLNTKLNTDSLQGVYFKVAFPVAQKNGYTPLGGLGVTDVPFQGNYHPEVVALGKWPSVDQREVALLALEQEVDRFHTMRREIWSTFNLAYYELEEDLVLEILSDEYYVITNFWKKDDDKTFDSYVESWNARVESSNGSHVVQLKEGKAPFGYRFNPDYTSITAWKSASDFIDFLESSKKNGNAVLDHISQFRIQ